MVSDAAASHPAGGALPTFVVIGAMKCGTTALHRLLGKHPQIGVSEPKELNFFFGDLTHDSGWCAGNARRGLTWYAAHFPPGYTARGEASPGYTSPDHAETAAARMAATLPNVRLIYLVRDPVQRAVSQWRHHRRDGTERRPLGQALLDPHSQYLARSRYAERLAPFLDRFPRDQLTLVAQEELRAEPMPTLRRLGAWLGVDPGLTPSVHQPGPVRSPLALDPRLRARLSAHLRDDTDRLQSLAGRALPWRG